jgi:hypothetical protein
MDEVIAQFTAYAGERRGELLRAAVADDLLGKSLANR